MKYAICNEIFQDWSFERAFAYAKDCGYTGIEVAPFTLGESAYDVPRKRRGEIKDQITEAGLECVGLHWLLAKTEGYYLTTPDRAVQKATGDYLAELARLCRDLDGSIMVLGSPQQRNLLPGVTNSEAMDFAATIIKSAIPILEDCGVTLALEPLGPNEGDFLNTAASAIELVEMVDSPNCRLHLDVKAMSSENQPIDQIIRDSVPHVAHFHANDPNLLGPGMGDVEFAPIFSALQEIGYQGWVSVEVFDYDPGIETICEQSITYMEKIYSQV